jgi:hypothetical protein
MIGTDDRMGETMDATTVLIAVGAVVAVAVALLGSWVLNSLGFGPDHDPAARDDGHD